MMQEQKKWSLPLGATVCPSGVQFRVWAPQRTRVEVALLEPHTTLFPLAPEGDGYFSGFVPQRKAGARYWYRLDGDREYPDPCARFQPEGPHGPSMVVDLRAYPWQDADWPGVRMPGQVIYELHIGAFTPEGTFAATARELAELQRLGITLIEVLPVAEFPGRWNWGYDGVGLYAPSHTYGDAVAFKRFVEAAHAQGLGVILDVVYNHLGPDGNYLTAYSDAYFTDRYKTDWGAALNFDGPHSHAVREFIIENACYWIAEFHLDGLRLDATQNIYDAGPVHVLAELSQRTRETAGPRQIVLIAENEPQQIQCLTPVEQGDYGLDAMWNDDFHHAALVALTGRREAYNSKLDGTERIAHAPLVLFHQDLLRPRREDSLIARQDHTRLEGAILGVGALVVRYFGDGGEDRLLVVNLGSDLDYVPAPEPLLAPSTGGSWQLVWSSDHPRYGGPGIINPCGKEGWRLSEASAVFFMAQCALHKPLLGLL